MKKIISLLRADQILRGNITFAGLLSILFVNIHVLESCIELLLKGGHLTEIRQSAYVILELDAIFIIVMIMMYFISEHLFSIKNAAILSFILISGMCIYMALTGTQAPVFEWIANIISSSIILFYTLVCIGVTIRSIWEGLQDRVGGEYKSLNLTYKSVLKQKNIVVFSLTLAIYTISSWYSDQGVIGIKQLSVALLIGIVTYLIGMIAKIIFDFGSNLKSCLRK